LGIESGLASRLAATLVSAFAFLLVPFAGQCADIAASDAHAAHHHVLQAPPATSRTTGSYQIPNVVLKRSDGTVVKLAQQIDDGRPVLLDFVYTSCSTICPVMSRTFAEVQTRLGADAARLQMISISIDPEEDTPARLTEYARKFDAGPQWSFYTGTVEASTAVQRAFGIYRGDKMNHPPVTFYRSGPTADWVRLDGFITPESILQEASPKLARR
jgi:protein SCO1/2